MVQLGSICVCGPIPLLSTERRGSQGRCLDIPYHQLCASALGRVVVQHARCVRVLYSNYIEDVHVVSCAFCVSMSSAGQLHAICQLVHFAHHLCIKIRSVRSVVQRIDGFSLIMDSFVYEARQHIAENTRVSML